MNWRRVLEAIRTGGLSEREPIPDDGSFCERYPRCRHKTTGYCGVPDNCGHFMPKYPKAPKEDGDA
jgi:hypothetical protein